MSTGQSALENLGRLELLAQLDTPVHRLDPRAKVFTTLVFILCVVSFPKYEVSALLPYVLYPLVLLVLGNLPAGYMLSRLLPAVPFVLLVGIFNPFFDRRVLGELGGFVITGGWVSFSSILLRFFLTVFSALILIASTGLYPICLGLQKFGLPRIFLVQILFLYRYLFVLIEETLRLSRAYRLRTSGRRGVDLTVYKTLMGNLLVRTIDRAQRIHTAMLSRGFEGEIHLASPLHFARRDAFFVLGWSAFFILARLHDLPFILGNLVTGGHP